MLSEDPEDAATAGQTTHAATAGRAHGSGTLEAVALPVRLRDGDGQPGRPGTARPH